MSTRLGVAIEGLVESAHRALIAVVLVAGALPRTVFGPQFVRNRDPSGNEGQQQSLQVSRFGVRCSRDVAGSRAPRQVGVDVEDSSRRGAKILVRRCLAEFVFSAVPPEDDTSFVF